MKIDSRIETIFSHAAALDQSGRLRSVIQVIDRDIYILNTDKTILFRFVLPSSAPSFEHCVTFNANDYDSSDFIESEGKVVFTQQGNEYIRTKSCGIPDQIDMRKLFSEFEMPKTNRSQVTLSKEIISFLNPSLSHIEFMAENKELIIIQKNIYDGTIIRITKRNMGGFGVGHSDEINTGGFGPIGVRTNDFLALFSFNDLLEMYFNRDVNYCRVRGRNFRMDCVIALCVYDELGNITLSKGVK